MLFSITKEKLVSRYTPKGTSTWVTLFPKVLLNYDALKFLEIVTHIISFWCSSQIFTKLLGDRQLISTTGYNFQKIANVWRHLYLGVGFLISLVKIIMCCITSCLPRGMNIWELCLFVWRQICFLPTLRSFPSVDLRESGRLLKVRWGMGVHIVWLRSFLKAP